MHSGRPPGSAVVGATGDGGDLRAGALDIAIDDIGGTGRAVAASEEESEEGNTGEGEKYHRHGSKFAIIKIPPKVAVLT